MRSDNGSSWFNVFVAVILIVIGFLREPLLAVLGGIIFLTTVLVIFIEEYYKRKVDGIFEEQIRTYSEQVQTLSKSSVTSVIR